MLADHRITAAGAVALAIITIVVVAISPWADGSSADGALQGDADCSESIDSLDALAALRFAAGAEPFAGCVEQAGDVNCDGDVNEGDVLLLLRFVGGLSPAQPSSAACPPIGEPLDALGLSISFTTAAVVIAQLFVSAPFYIRGAYAGFMAVDPRFEGVAYTLGLSRWRTFRSVTLPLVWPALAGGAVLCWARALGDFRPVLGFAGTTRMKTEVLPTSVFLEWNLGEIEGALAVSILLVLIAVVVLGATRLLGLPRGGL